MQSTRLSPVARRLLSGLMFLGVAVALAVTLFASDLSAQALSMNSDPTATLSAGVRYRNLNNGGGSEVLVFPSPCCITTTDGQGTWPASSNISITYGGGFLSTTAAGTMTSRLVGNLGALNYILITIMKQATSTSIALNSISLGGPSLGNAVVNAAPNSQVWKITGANLTAGFTLTATLATTGLSGGGDSNFVQVEVGYVPPADDQGPLTSSVATSPIPALLNGIVTVTANVSDVARGGSNILSAEYSLNNGAWTPMAAQDNAFDGPDEDVQQTFTATELGLNTICVRGTDVLNNIGVPACQNFLVTYKFTGFFSPIDNEPVNLAKAGQAVPAKWRLTDANDVPIATPASFVDLWSYPVGCNDFSGDPADSIEEVSSGASGLQYAGDGYWQYNWKTPKSYADTCRAMYVEFNGGALSPVVKFRFRR